MGSVKMRMHPETPWDTLEARTSHYQMLEDWVCPSSYTPTAQILISFSLGVIFSAWNVSLVVLLFYLLIYEVLFYSFVSTRWSSIVRVGVIVAYVTGWLMGRSLYKSDMAFIVEDEDRSRLGDASLCKGL